MSKHVSNYVECDIPEGLTLAEWRRARCAPVAPPRRRLRALIPARLRATAGA